LALSLVVGVLVDDAIVEIENIERHLVMGKSPYQAAMEAADEIGLAVIATTFTLVAVFLPTAFMGGIPGRIFSQFGVTASVAVLASLLVARLLTPMMAAYLLRPKLAGQHEVSVDGATMGRYLRWVGASLGRRRRTVALSLAFLVVSLGMTPFIATSFMPAQDKAQSSVSLQLPPGSRLEETVAAAERASELLRTLPE
ncbi:RND transporter, partial [Rubrivivax gelatinosus]|nr:RND transporter [Rubrivivax gelatinosus]